MDNKEHELWLEWRKEYGEMKQMRIDADLDDLMEDIFKLAIDWLESDKGDSDPHTLRAFAGRYASAQDRMRMAVTDAATMLAMRRAKGGES